MNVLYYLDPADGLRGWLAYDGRDSRLAAGGCRVQRGLTVAELGVLAGRMTIKQRVLGINVDGAKCGIDYDPRSAGKADALARFLSFLRDELCTRFSMGSDMGTEWNELQGIAAGVGIPSVKYAIKTAQGLTDDEFFTRMARLDDRVGLLTLSQRRAGHALGHAAIGAARAADVAGDVTCALQGFGTLGRAAACSLLEEGVRLTAIADEHGCIADPAGLDVARMLASPLRMPVPQIDVPGQRLSSSALLDLPADVLVLAAGADAMSEAAAADPQFAAVVVGANCGLSEAVEDVLHRRGVLVVPDFIGGIGGSASMEALFGPSRPPSAQQVLDNLAHLMRELVDDIAATSKRTGTTPREVGLHLASTATVDVEAPPYGQCRYLATSVD
ncbi:MAG: Glu/Leu/Phe/Val dehydrogenase dimerization domain-containing protein [Frankiaceae bacterium]